MSRLTSRASRAAQDDLGNVPRRVVEGLCSHALICEQLPKGLWRIPGTKPRTRSFRRHDLCGLTRLFQDASKPHLEAPEGIRSRLDLRQEAVERRDVAADGKRAEGV